MPIDRNSVQWDDDTLDPADVQWDEEPVKKAAKKESTPRTTDGMGQYARYLAGLGSSAVETYKGVKQAGTDAMLRSAAVGSAALGAVGMDDMREGFDRNVSAPLARSSGRQMQETAERRETNADLMSTGAGRLGSIVGTAAQFLGPGLLGRGTVAAPMLLPRTMAGSAAQGAVIGSVQPVAEVGERGTNTGVGFGAGAIGHAIPALVGGTIRTAGALVQPFVQRGQERIIASTLRESATAPARLGSAAPSQIPGVTRTLAEETADPGIAQLQRQFPAQMADVASRNNAARVGEIRNVFEGADIPSVNAIKSARDAAANASLRKVRSSGAIDTSAVKGALDASIKRHAGNPATQKALQEIAAEMPTIRTAQEAINYRKYIDSVLSKQSEKPAARAAQRELLAVKGILDRALVKASPDWKPYLTNYVAQSKRADQASVGATLLGRAKQSVDPTTGERMLTANTLARSANDPDGLLRAATGFRKSRADRTLTPQQRGTLGALMDDAGRMDFAASGGRAAGSDTAQNLATRNVMRSMMGDSRLGQIIAGAQPTQRLASVLEKTYGVAGVPQRLQDVLVEALQRPEYAREILARLPAPDRLLLTQAMSRAGGFTGAVSPAFAE